MGFQCEKLSKFRNYVFLAFKVFFCIIFISVFIFFSNFFKDFNFHFHWWLSSFHWTHSALSVKEIIRQYGIWHMTNFAPGISGFPPVSRILDHFQKFALKTTQFFFVVCSSRIHYLHNATASVCIIPIYIFQCIR